MFVQVAGTSHNFTVAYEQVQSTIPSYCCQNVYYYTLKNIEWLTTATNHTIVVHPSNYTMYNRTTSVVELHDKEMARVILAEDRDGKLLILSVSVYWPCP